MQSNVINAIQQSLAMIASGLNNLANNPGMPEIVRNEFSNLASNASSNIAIIKLEAEGQIVAGLGPQSIALRNAVTYLNMPVEGNIERLAVILPKSIAPEHELYAMCRWSQMFLKEWPSEMFDSDGKILKVIHRDDLIIEVELEPIASTAEMKSIGRICYRIYTPENWWDVSGTIDKSSALYSKDFRYSNTVIHHHVEMAYVYAENGALAKSVLDIVAEEMMGDEYIDTVIPQAPQSADATISPTALLEIASGRVHKDRVMQALDKGMYHFSSKTRGVYDRRIDFEGGHLIIKTNDSDWDSWGRMLESKKEHSWQRDKSPLVISEIILSGISVGNRRLPTAILNTMKTAIETYMAGLFPDAEWYTPIPVKQETD